MSANNAIKQREESIKEYQRILQTETSQSRIIDINERIQICKDEIELLKNNKPIFGKAKPLPQETRIYEPNPEKKGEQKVTIITNNLDSKGKTEKITLSDNKIGNSLRNALQEKAAESNKSSLRSRIMTARAKTKQLDV